MTLIESGRIFSGPIEDDAAYLYEEDQITGKITGILIVPREKLPLFYRLIQEPEDLTYEKDPAAESEISIDNDARLILQGIASKITHKKWVTFDRRGGRLPLEQTRHFVFGIRDNTNDMVALPSSIVSIPTLYKRLPFQDAVDLEGQQAGEDPTLSLRRILKKRLSTVGLNTDDLFRSRGGDPTYKLPQRGGWFGNPPESGRNAPEKTEMPPEPDPGADALPFE